MPDPDGRPGPAAAAGRDTGDDVVAGPPHELLVPDVPSLRAAVAGRLDDGVVVRADHVEMAHACRTGRFYRHGWQSWSPARWIRLDHEPRDEPAGRGDGWTWPTGGGHAQDAASHWVGAVEGRDGRVLLLGALGLGARVTASRSRLEGRAPQPVDWYLVRGDVEHVFGQYARHLAATFGARSQDPGNVWCTWYSLGDDLSRARVEDVLDQLDGWPVDVFLVDDGWSRSIGDWEANEHFPGGMQSLADRIAATGRRPGLWLAPMIAHESSRLARAHPEWLVHDEAGRPAVAGRNWGGRFHGLDVTHPDVRDHLAGLFHRVATTWGWSHLKLDFLYGAAIPGRRHDDVDGEHAYRAGLELVREVVGDAVHLNACGAPIVPSLGICDSIRVSADVRPIWEDYQSRGTRHAMSTSLARLWLGAVVKPDPDVAWFRSCGNLLTARERRLTADLGHVTGFRSTSDPPGWLSDDEANQLRQFLSGRPVVSRTGRHTFDLDGRRVDFSAASFDHPAARPAPEPARAPVGGT